MVVRAGLITSNKGFLKEMAGTSLFYGGAPVSEDLLVPTRRRRRKE
jgi:hypothetical protein